MYPYTKRIPLDQDGMKMQNLPPAFPAVQTSGYAPPAASSVITLSPNTTAIEITALNASLAIKWGPNSVIAAAGATANFDHIIPVNQTRRFVVPQSVIGISMGGSVAGINQTAGLYNSLSMIATTSVLTAVTEF